MNLEDLAARCGDRPRRRETDEDRRQRTRDAVIAAIAQKIRDEGLTKAQAKVRFRDVPETLVLLALVRNVQADTDAWLDSMANTIEGEIVARAIEAKAG